MSKFQIFTDSNCDLSTQIRKVNNLEYLRMNVVVDGSEMYADLDWELYSPETFYGWLASGKKVKTNAVPYAEFIERFTPFLEKGMDILYIGCSSALTVSTNTCRLVSEELLAKYPERKIITLDSLNASCCLGMIALDACKMQQEGKSMEEIVDILEETKLNYNFFATVETLKYMKNAGRIKGSKAFMGDLIGMKPIFISDAHGNNFGIKTVRGSKKADVELIEGIKSVINLDECKEMVVGHAVNLERATRLKEELEKILKIKVRIENIGPIVGTTCGPGTTAVFCYGKKVTRFEGDGIK